MFLTLEDPRAKVNGSRDPLGVQPIWTAFGRRLVTNLTTVTNLVRGFTILLLGRYAAERLIERGTVGEQDALPVFLRMEQVGAYARHVGHGVEGDIRGIERVKRFLSKYGSRVPIRDDASGLILSDQKTYGLWGLFTVAARVSGLLPEGPVGLTPRAREFVEATYWPRLKPVEERLFRLLAKGGYLKTIKNDSLFKAVASVFPDRFTKQELLFYGEVLRDARFVETNGQPNRQQHLAELMGTHTALTSGIGRKTVLTLAKAGVGKDEWLSDRLLRVVRLEATLAPAEAIFEHLQARSGKTPAQVAKGLTAHWDGGVPNLDRASFQAIVPEIQTVSGPELASVIDRCDMAMSDGQYEQAIEALLEWNRMVMAARKASPWVRLQAGKLDVRYRSIEQVLPARQELPVLWRNSYFLDSLRVVTHLLGSPG